jgi:hypothetical protein
VIASRLDRDRWLLPAFGARLHRPVWVARHGQPVALASCNRAIRLSVTRTDDYERQAAVLDDSFVQRCCGTCLRRVLPG